jgi:hypothetical protein
MDFCPLQESDAELLSPAGGDSGLVWRPQPESGNKSSRHVIAKRLKSAVQQSFGRCPGPAGHFFIVHPRDKQTAD